MSTKCAGQTWDMPIESLVLGLIEIVLELITYPVVEVLAIGRGLDYSTPDAEVAKSLSFLSLERVSLQERLHDLQNLFLLDARSVELVQALAVVTTTKVHVVRAVGLTDEGNLSKPRASATVGATSHTHDNGVLAKTVLLKARLELGDEDGQVTLRLGHGKTASGESNTGGRAETQTGEGDVVKLVLLQQLLHGGEVLISNIAEDDMLVTSQAEFTLVDLGNLPETSLHLELGGIFDTTVLDEQGEVVQAGLVLDPAEGVDVALEFERTRSRELLAPQLLNLATVDINAHIIDGVLETSVLAVLTVTVIALDKHDLLADDVSILHGDETEHSTGLGVGLLVVVGSTHTTSSKNVETSKATVFALDSNQTDIVCVHIGIVVRRNSDCDLELSGEVGGTVEGLKVLDSVTSNLGLLVIVICEPDFVISSGRWQEVVADLLGDGVNLSVELGLCGKRAAHDVSVDITAGGNGGHQGTINGLHGRLELALDHTVELEGLTSSKLHRLVSEGVGDVVHLNPLERSRDTTGETASNHEGVSRLQALGLALITNITVILHVGTMELGELTVSCGDGASGRVVQSLDDGTTEVVGGQLDVLISDWGRLIRETIDVIHAKGLPDLRLPVSIAGLVTIRILVVTEASVGQVLAAEIGQKAVQILGRLVVENLVLLARPVVAVTQTEDGVVHGSKVQISAVLDSIPEWQTVLGELTLTSSGGDEDNDGSLEATGTSPVAETLGNVSSVTVVGREQDGQRSTQEAFKQLGVGILGLALLLSSDFSSEVLGQTGSKLRLLLHQLSELVVSSKEGLEFLLDQLGVEREVGLALLLVLGVPTVKGPVTGIDSLLGLLENGLENLGVRAIDGGRGNVDIAEVHGVQTDILLTALGISGGLLRVGGRVDDEHVDVLSGSQNMVDTGVSEVVGPSIGTSQPERFLAEQALVSEELLGQGRTVGLKTGDDIVGDLSRLGDIISIHSPACQPVRGSLSDELLAGSGSLGLRNESVLGLQGVCDVGPTAEELIQNLSVCGLKSGNLNTILSLLFRSLPDADLEVLDGLLGSQVLEDTSKGLANDFRVNIAQLVANNVLNATRAAFDRGQDIDQEGSPLGCLAADLLQNGNPLDRLGERVNKVAANPRPVESRGQDTSLGEDLIALGVIEGFAEGANISAKDEKAVGSISRAGVLKGAV
ncbi:unnamed protein product [Clonostachys rosea]|uniref:Uncharacterized protein n=1 Tax=Bionectria ochroleuca TaxID=29856 RepID=A0ABY6TPV4_BIOOC|nr:unnamed protein product [Clonostachys rosea]